MAFTLNEEQKDIMRAAHEFASKEFSGVAEEFDRNETKAKILRFFQYEINESEQFR
jgi:hypothetical protein